MPEVVISVGGARYEGWTAARITRGIEAVSGGFELELTDRWAEEGVPWPIREEDPCTLELDGVTVIDGFIDRRSIAYSATSREVSVAGRDRTAALIDCSARPAEYRKATVLDLARRLADPFGITVSIQPGIVLPRIEKLSVDPGESAFDALERACRMAGVLPVSDGAGGLVLTRAGATRAVTDLVEGVNILSASLDVDATGRYRTYVVAGQAQGTDVFSGKAAAAVRGEAEDLGVRRTDRVLRIRPESGATAEYARQRAAWEAAVRAGRALGVRVTVQGWQQGDGSLWPVNAIVHLRSPLLELDDDLLISQATYRLDSSGTTTELVLRRPEAFIPQPQVPARQVGRAGLRALLGSD